MKPYPSNSFPKPAWVLTLCLACLVGLGLNACKQNAKEQEQPLFKSVPSILSGVDFENQVNDKEEVTIYDNIYVYNGGGAAAGDLNNDGLPDIFLVSNQGQSQLYWNLGDFKFENGTPNSGILDTGGWSTGVTLADVNADGWLDIYLCKAGFHATKDRNNLLYLNQQDGTFREAGAEFGLNSPATSTHASFFDYDLDGDLDCYLVNHPENFDLIMDFYYYIKDPAVDTLNMNRLYQNQEGRFVDVTLESGIGFEKGFGLSVRTTDANLDGFPDIFVANDFLTPDYFYSNNGDGTFTEKMEESFDQVSLFSMGSDFGDVNNDGLPDLMVVDMEPFTHYRRKCNDITFPIEFYEQQSEFFKGEQFSRNMLHLGRADGTFSEVGEWAGIAKTDWSWNILLEDLDHDGWQDVFITNGTKRELNERDYMSLAFGEEKVGSSKIKHNADELIDSLPVAILPNQAFRNQCNGRFAPASNWGLNQAATSSGAALADFDLDGDLDLIVNNTDTLAFLYRNQAENKSNHYLKIKLEGQAANPFGIGTKISATAGKMTWYRELACNRGFQSSSEPMIFLGLGEVTNLERLEIVWPDGKRETLKNVAIDQTLAFNYLNAKSLDEAVSSATPKAIFTTIPAPDFQHQENKFNDFKRDKIIPQMLSREGPCLASGDVNGDGKADLYLGGAAGYPGKLFLGNGAGGYSKTQGPWSEDLASEDLGACFFDANGDGKQDLYVASGGNEFNPGSPELQDRLYLNLGDGEFEKSTDALPDHNEATCSPVAFDFDMDGDEDLFVAGRMIPGQFGKPGISALLRNEGGEFSDATDELAPGLRETGMVTSAQWADVDRDGWLDLVLVGQWMSPEVWLNIEGKLKFDNLALAHPIPGWWNTLTPVDLDMDGDLDFALGNFGWNTIYKGSEKEPLELWGADFDGSGSWDPLLLHFLQGELGTFVDRDLFCKSMPDFFNQFHTYKSFAEKAPKNLFSKEILESALRLKATEMASGWLENTEKGMYFHPFPDEVQQAPVRTIIPADFNADGKMDLLLAGNSSAHFYDLGKIMASRGNLLLATDDGFRSVSMEESGLNLKGEFASGAILHDSEETIRIILGMNGGTPIQLELNSRSKSN